MPWVEAEESKGKWVEVSEQPMDRLTRSANPLKHIARIPKVYQEQIRSGLQGMREGNVLQKGLGALQYVVAPLNAPIRAMVGEPVQSVAEQAGVPRRIAEPLGMAAEVGIGFVPIKGTSMLSNVAQTAGVGQKYGGLPTKVQKITPETWKELGEVPNRPLTDLAAQYHRPKPAETRTLSELMDEAMNAKLPATPSEFQFGRMPLKGIFTEKIHDSVDAFNEAIARLKIPKNREVTTDEILSVWRNVEDNNTELQSYIKGLSDREKVSLAKNAMKGEIPKGFGFKYRERPYQEFTLRPEPEGGATTSNLPKVQYPVSIMEQRLRNQGGFVDLAPIYDKVFKPEGPRFAKEKSKVWKDIKLKADEFAGMVSTRVGNIAPELKARLRKYVFDEGLSTTNDLKGIEPFYRKFNKLDKTTQFKLTEMLSNGKIQDAEQIMQQKGMLFEFRKAEKVKNNLWTRAKESGIEAGDLPNYFPRKVRNYEELKSQMGSELKTQVDKAIDEIQKKQGRVLSIEEKGSIADSVLRGYNVGGVPIGAPSFAKERKIAQLTPELTQHYYPAHDTLRQYVESLNSKIAQNKFFGKDLKNVSDETLAKMGLSTQTDLEASIGTTLERLKAEGNTISPDQEIQLKNMLSAVFSPKMTGEATQMTKDIVYTATLTNVSSALTQIQDLALALEKEGLFNTLRGITKAISGKGVSIQDLGIENIAQEMNQSKSPVNWLLKEGLKWSGFRAIDKLGKETVINGALSKYQNMAQKNPQKLNKILNVVFGDEASKVAQDLLNKKVTEDVKFLLFNELSDLQPISKIEVPEKYLTADSGKIFYALKTYQLKLFDIYRNDIFKTIKEGNVREGLGRLGRLTASLVLLGAGVDQIKDFVLNRKTDFDDLVVDNFLKIGGMSKYTTWQARREGIPRAVINTLAPPMGVLADIGKDINKLYGEYISSDIKRVKSASKKGFETTKDIPLVGKPYYWWFGEGSRKEMNKQKKANN